MKRYFVFTRLLTVLLVLAGLAAGPSVLGAKESELKIVRVFTGWRDAESFKRISEYFDGKEHTGGEVVLRTHPELRAGYYFLARVTNPGTALDAKLVLQVVLPGNEVPHTFTFPVSLSTKSTVFNLGLTGADWPDAKSHPVAWKLDVVGGDGQVLTTEKSYLWERPAGS